MRIEKDCIVSIDYTLRNSEGVLLGANAGTEPFSYLHGYQQVVPGLEEALAGKAKHDTVSVAVPPERGYGRWDPERVLSVPRAGLPDGVELEAGVSFRLELPDGAVRPVMIAEVHEASVTIDTNHVLAGTTLHFDVTVCDVRHATQNELEQAQRSRAG